MSRRDRNTYYREVAFYNEVSTAGGIYRDVDNPVVTNPSALDDTQREYYDVFTQYNPGVSMPLAELDNWVRFGRSPLYYEARLSGAITNFGLESGNSIEFVSQNALDIMGGEYLGSGDQAGNLVIMPTGTTISDSESFKYLELTPEQWENLGLNPEWIEEQGYGAFASTGNPTRGLHHRIGIDDVVPHEIYAVMDATSPIAPATETFGGTEGRQEADKTWEGMGVRDFKQYYDAGAGAALMIGMSTLWGPLGAAGAAGIISVSKYHKAKALGSRNYHFEDFAEDFAWDVGSAYIGGHFGPGGSAVMAGARAEIQGDGNFFEEAGWSLAGSFTAGFSNYARAYIDDDYTWEKAHMSVASGAARAAAGYSHAKYNPDGDQTGGKTLGDYYTERFGFGDSEDFWVKADEVRETIADIKSGASTFGGWASGLFDEPTDAEASVSDPVINRVIQDNQTSGTQTINTDDYVIAESSGGDSWIDDPEARANSGAPV